MTFLAAALLTFNAQDPLVLTWGELVPDGVANQPPMMTFHDGGVPEQSGSAEIVPELDGEYIRIPGFMLPIEYTERGLVSGFLLVPYFGACIHVPPPPPNQIVYVDTSEEPVESMGLWDPVWVIGTMSARLNVNDLGNAAYTLSLDEMLPYYDY